jgi:peptidoglycan-associated lipoprotein
MTKRTQAFVRAGAILLACMLLMLAAGCKKKVPPPPPPPAATKSVEPPSAPVAKPAINSFTAEPTRIERGQAATLRWSVSNATDINIDQGVGPVQQNANRQVYPSNSTTYTLIANGPGGSDTRSVTVEVASTPAPPPAAPPPTTRRSATDILASDVQDVYFDYDKSDVREDSRAALTKNADTLKQLFTDNPSFSVMVEGHCDERGSAEYNLGLGDRRATSTKEFLVQMGVPADRLKTISYGKERPQCTESNESCYQRNRRAHFAAGQ